ncbi:MAG: hypothetical protein ACK58L_12170 [Planctomycetota bacterium]
MVRLIVLSMFLSALGCGSGGIAPPARIPVSGVVTYNNKPVSGAIVSFHNEKAPRTATGVTDQEGKFTLTMIDDKDGAVAGVNIITVTKNEAPAAAPVSNGPPSPADMAKKMAEMKQEGDPRKKQDDGLLPSRYASPSTSPLKEEVSAQKNSFVLVLSD